MAYDTELYELEHRFWFIDLSFKNLSDYNDDELRVIVQKLLIDQKYLKSDVTLSDVTVRGLKGPDGGLKFIEGSNMEESIKYLKTINRSSINKIRKYLGSERYKEFADPTSEVNNNTFQMPKLLLTMLEYMNPLEWSTTKIVIMVIVLAYFFAFFDGSFNEDCISLTYQDFDSNYNVVTKEGRICDDAKDKLLFERSMNGLPPPDQ